MTRKIYKKIVSCISALLFLNLSSYAQVGAVLDFDGSDDYVDLGSTALKPTAGLTAEGWVYMASWGGVPTFFGNTQASGYAIYIQGTDLKALVRRNGSYAVVQTPLSGIPGGWHHLAVTYDGRYTKLYVDALLMSTDDAGGTYPINYIGNNTFFGAEGYFGASPEPGYYFTGQMDEIRIWNYARTQCQLYTFKNCEIPTSAPGLLGNYHFNQGLASGGNGFTTSLTDASGNSNNGTLYNFSLLGGASNWLAPGPFTSGYTTSAPGPTVTTGTEYSVTIVIPNGSTPLSSFSPWVYPFMDPLPANAIITGINLVYDGVDQGWGGSGCTASFFLNGEYFAANVLSHSWQNFNNVNTGPYPGYVHSGFNTFEMYFCGWAGWQSFFANGSLTLRYQILNPTPVNVCQNSTTILKGYGASTYTWSGGAIDGVPSIITTSQVYTVTGATAYNCISSATIQVNATPAPTITSISGGTLVCDGSSLVLNINAIGGATSYSWSTGATTNTTVIAPLVNTTYTATANSTLTGCSHSVTTLITVSPLPTITVNSGTICSGKVFTLSPGGALTYTYSSGSNTVAPLSNSSYSVTGTDGFGCVSAGPAVSSVVVNTSPTVSVNSGAICFGNSFTITPTGALSYTFLSGATVVTPASSTTYSIIGESAQNCISTNTALSSVAVNTLPIVSITSSTPAVCIGANTTLNGNGANTYTWTGGISNGVAFSPTVTATYSVNGTNTLTGCTGTNNAALTVTVYALPVISIGNFNICSGNSVTLNPSGASTYTYSSGSNVVTPSVTTSYSITGTSTAGCISAGPAVSNISVNITPTISVTSGTICAGNAFTMVPSGASTYTFSSGTAIVSPLSNTAYSVTGTATNGCVSLNPAVSNVTVFARPVVAASSVTNTICYGGTTSLTASNASTYTWSPGSLIGSTVAVSPTVSTSYSLVGTSTAGCTSTNSAVQLITVNPLPTLTAAPNPTAICFGASSTLTVSGGSTYTWNPGALSGSNIAVTPAITSTYNVSGKSIFGCLSQNTVVLTVIVNALPTVTAGTTNSVICFGNSTTLNGSGANTYTWTGGVTNAVSFTPAASGSYSLSGTNTLTGCTSTNVAVQGITVNPLPVVSITTNSAAICFGQSSTLTANNAQTYTWTPGPVNGANFTVTPGSTTSYSLAGTSSLGCTSTNTPVQVITVYTLPIVSANTSTTSVCIGNSVTLSGSGANTFTWSGGALNGVPFAPVTTASYAVSGTNTLTGCTSTNLAVQTITVNVLPNVSISTPSPVICYGYSTSLSGVGANSYTWTGGISNGAPFTPASSASYTVVGLSAIGCTNSAVQGITVNALPIVTANSSQTAICIGGTVMLSGGGADTYVWTSPVINAVPFSPNATANYSVTGTNTLTGCTSTNSAVQTIVVNPLPVVSATVSNPAICNGFTTAIGGVGANTYVWSGGIVNGQAFSPTVSATYTVSGTDGNACVNTATTSVTVHQLPILSVISTSTLSCEAANVTLIALGASTYTWNTNPPVSSTTILITPTATSVYTVTGTDLNGCVNTTAYTQSVMPCPSLFTVQPNIYNSSCSGKSDGRIVLNPQITYTNYAVTYIWTPSTVCPSNNCTELNNLPAGSYSVEPRISYTINTVMVKTETLSVSRFDLLDGTSPCEITVYNGLTLNNDNVNDKWEIGNILQFPNNTVMVFTRWGSKIFEVQGYNNADKIWPVPNETEKLESATYYYVIDLYGDGKKVQKGWIEVMKP